MAKNKDKKDTKSANGHHYSAQDIQVLEGLEPVRKRPGMYIGTTGPDGLHHLITEIFDNSRDEAMGGFADDVEIVLLPGNEVRVTDNGRGIPVDKHKQTGSSALETIMTTLHAGGKFGGEGYKVSGGLHGVGASVVNALSSSMKVTVHRDGSFYTQEYAMGKKKSAVKKVGASKLHGTIVRFVPDPEIFEKGENKIDFSFDRVVNHMREQAYLVKGLRISVIDAREVNQKMDTDKVYYFRELGIDAPSRTFYFEGGLKSLIKFYNQNFKPVNKKVFYVDKPAEGVESVEVSLQYVDDISSRLFAFANNIRTPEGGTHVTGFKTALTRTLNSYARKNNMVRDSEENFTGDDVLEGLTAVVSVKLREIQFEGQTKAKLGSVEAQGAVATIFSEAFSEFLEENPDEGKAMVQKSMLALKARKAAKAAKDSVLRKGALEGMTLPGKLADCETKTAEDAELFIVEGDSAGGSGKMGRDRKTQAVLPLKGKILNVERARLDRILGFAEIKALVIALGAAIGDTFDISKLRYHKIIIATDADTDGGHIRTLLLTLFYRYFRPLVDGGYIYIAQPPLYKIKKGKESFYFYTESEKNEFYKKEGVSIGGDEDETDTSESSGEESESENEEGEEDNADSKSGKKSPKLLSQRYKGLGEMNPEELWETTMDPEKRVLKQIKVEDAAMADKIFDVLMGTDVPARKSFIQSNAAKATLDI